ncbi:MAG: PucR family transcriptional regulator ligand-binding domain-containing protein [Desulfosporosinus sp.]|nr:PucR family transcriptional regulator ligand-binding domain-containing protein [Desulfosporosinus sp.]
MAVTLSELCATELFRSGFRLIAGSGGLDREVRHVTVMEVPDFPDYMQENVFVLSTLYSMKDSESLLQEVMTKLGKCRIAGLAIKIDRFVEQVPSCMVQLAEEFDLPLFSMSKEITFREVINTVLSEVINEQFGTIKCLHEQYELLLGSVLEGDKIGTFLDNLGKILDCYCACVATSGKILAQYRPTPEDDVGVELLLQDEAYRSSPVVSPAQYGDFYLFPCLAHQHVLGHIIVKMTKQPNDRELLLIKQVVGFVSIKLLEKHLMIETEQRMVTAIADEILFRRYQDESIVQDRVQLLGLNPQKHHMVLLLSFRSKDDSADSLQIVKRQWFVRLQTEFPNSAVFLKAPEIVVIISLPEKSPLLSDAYLRRTLKTFLKGRPEKESNDVDIGYSFLVKDMRRLPDCYEQAQKAVALGRTFKPESNVFCYSDFIKEGLLLRGIDTTEHRILIKQIINPIKEYDCKYHAELWLTLGTCLAASSLEKAAQELHIHSSTLRYRLGKIKTLTNIDFFSAEGRLSLNLTYILAKLTPMSP